MITGWNYLGCKGESIDRWNFESFGMTLTVALPFGNTASI